MAEIEFYYDSNIIKIKCNKNEKLKDIFQKFKTNFGNCKNSFVYIYNGDLIKNEELSFDQLANSEDKKRNKMNVLVSISDNSNSSQFIYEKCKVEDDEMKEFAEMSILYAIQKYPDNDWEKCLLVKKKFDEKYGGLWGVSFLKTGDSANSYFGYYIKVKYGGYIIKILRTGEN